MKNLSNRWMRPHFVYAAGAGVLWMIFVAAIAALYVALRMATGASASPQQLALFLAADAAIAGGAGWWLLRRARAWAAEGRTPVDVARVLVVWSVVAITVVSAFVLGIGVVNAEGQWTEAAGRLLARRWPGMLVDYGFLWAIAVSVVPIPYLKAQYERLSAPTPMAEAAQRIAVRNGAAEVFVPIDEILAVTAAENYVELHTTERSFLHRATMAQMERLLPHPRFMRVHRRAIVRLDAVTAADRPKPNLVELTLANGRTVGVGRAYRSSLTPALKATVRHLS